MTVGHVVGGESGRSPVVAAVLSAVVPGAGQWYAGRRLRSLPHDRRIVLLALATGLPGMLVALGFLWFTPVSAGLRRLAAVLVAATHWLVWSALSGLEIGLFSCLGLWGIVLHLRERGEHSQANEFFGGKWPLTRALVYEDRIPVQTRIARWEDARQIIREADFLAVTKCFCRHKREHEGKACKQGAPVDDIADRGSATTISSPTASPRNWSRNFAPSCASNGAARFVSLFQQRLSPPGAVYPPSARSPRWF